MPVLRENAMCLLSSTVIADLNTGGYTRLFQVPAGKILIPDQIVIHSATGTLVATGTGDINIGGSSTNAATPVWVDAWAAFEEITDSADFYILRADNNENIVIDGDNATAANREFGIFIVTGADANGATFDLFGYLIDS